MKKLFAPLCISLSFVSCNNGNSPINDNQISLGVRDSIYSEILSEQREIWVHTPTAVSEGKKFPVLYLLDGRGHFYSVSGMTRQLSTTNGNTVLPEMIVVAIANTDRFRDLTPTHVGDSTSTSGGGDAFISFIRDELIPYIDGKYPTTNYRTMIGHSLGGLMVIHTLFRYPDMFDNYLAIDPSLWWDDRKLLKEVKESLSRQALEGKSLFVGIANTMPKGMDTTVVVNDTTRNTNHIQAILDFSKTTAENTDNGLNFLWKYYEDEDHGSVPLISEYDGLKFMFSWHRSPKWSEIMDQDKSAEDLVELIVSHYENVSTKFGYEVPPEERRMNIVGFTLMSRGMNEKARAIFDLNIRIYPDSPDTYESMGDYYVAQSDTTNAISFFEKALELGGGNSAQEKIDNLRLAED